MSANIFASAVEHFNAGHLDAAERLCRDVLTFNHGHFDALHMLGVIASRTGKLDAAAELYGRALAINSRSAECHFNLAQVLRAQGRVQEAATHLDRRSRSSATTSSRMSRSPTCWSQQSEFEQARSQYEGAGSSIHDRWTRAMDLASVLRNRAGSTRRLNSFARS